MRKSISQSPTIVSTCHEEMRKSDFVSRLQKNGKLRILDMCCGTKSVAKALTEHMVVTLDKDEARNPDIIVDLREWDLERYELKMRKEWSLEEWEPLFHFIWFSPDCAPYSRANTTGVRDTEKAWELLTAGENVISFFKPLFYVVENPQTGLLGNASNKRGKYMEDGGHLGWHTYDVDYCRYGCDYQKRTRLWTNIKTPFPSRLCKERTGVCPAMIGNVHKAQVQGQSMDTKFHVPRSLIRELINRCMKSFCEYSNL